jgi:hypothetical protein
MAQYEGVGWLLGWFAFMTKFVNIRERHVTIKSETWTTNIHSLRFRDIREWVTLWRLILRSLGCIWYFMSLWWLFGWRFLWMGEEILPWTMDEFIHWQKPCFLFSSTCDELLSWMIEVWIETWVPLRKKYLRTCINWSYQPISKCVLHSMSHYRCRMKKDTLWPNR